MPGGQNRCGRLASVVSGDAKGYTTVDFTLEVDGEWQPGLEPGRGSYLSFAEFRDPDGNVWLLQEIRRDSE